MTEEEFKVRGTGGSLQSDWTDSGTLDPISEWANEIIQEGIEKTAIVPIIQKGGQLRRANKKQLFWKSSVTRATGLWATGISDARSSEHPLDYDTTTIDPVEYRTMIPVAYETLDEVDNINLEADIRKQLGIYAAWKLAWMAYSKMDNEDIQSDGDWNVAGNALEYCNDNTVDYATELTVDNLQAGFDAIIADLYKPTDAFLPAALYSDLFNSSQFTNAAQYGSQNSAIIEGILPRYLGVDFHLETYMPDDSSANDVGIMIDRNFFEGMVVAKDANIKFKDRWETGEWEFCLGVKCGATVLQEKASCAFYT